VLGCSNDLLASVACTPKAKTHPYPHRKPRLGNIVVIIFFMDDSLVKHVTWDTKCLSGWVPNGKGLLYNKSDMVENYLHGLIDQF
jgi:hypothetical protein